MVYRWKAPSSMDDITLSWQGDISMRRKSEDDMAVRYEPIGVIACLTPWNYPIYQETAKIFPAIAAGNCIVLKPSQIAPVSAFVLAEAAREMGLPAGVINIVTGRGSEVGTLLAKHEDVDMVSFTGSTEQGKKVGMMGIESNVKKVALELGGKSASVILRSADYEKAAKSTMMGCFPQYGANMFGSYQDGRAKRDERKNWKSTSFLSQRLSPWVTRKTKK